MTDWKPDLFSYTDYRAYLRDYYLSAKAHHPRFSHRYFARRAGFTSPNFLKMVMDGDRNLGLDRVDSVADVLGLDTEERHFFAHLVAFNQADNHADRNRLFDLIAASRRFRAARQLDGPYFEYLSHWYYPAIREMVARADFSEEPAWVAAQLLPPIKPAQAAAALEALLRLGLLQRDKAGRLTRGEPTLTTGHEVQALAVANYHLAMLDRAGASIELIPPNERDLSAMTVCVARSRIPELKQRLRDFREGFMDVCDRDPAPEVVYQVNIQLFPLTQVDPEAGPKKHRAARSTSARSTSARSAKSKGGPP